MRRFFRIIKENGKYRAPVNQNDERFPVFYLKYTINHIPEQSNYADSKMETHKTCHCETHYAEIILQGKGVVVFMCDPLVVIPGIMGSELFFEGQMCWPPIEEEAFAAKTTIASAAKLFAEANTRMTRLAKEKLPGKGCVIPACGFPVRFPQTEPYKQTFGASLPENCVENGRAGAYNAYMDLCEYFHGRDPLLPIYFFGYDWRRSCVKNAQKLHTFIERIKEQNCCKRVKVAAHSLGCIVTARYLGQYGSGDIAAVATAGGPFLGSETVKPFLNRSLDPEQFLKQSPIGAGLDFIETLSPLLSASVLPVVYRVAENCSSLRELLPSACAEFSEEASWDSLPHYNFAGMGEETLEECSRETGSGVRGGDVYGDGDGQVLVTSATAGGRFRNTKFYRATHNELIFKEKCLQDIYDSLYNN